MVKWTILVKEIKNNIAKRIDRPGRAGSKENTINVSGQRLGTTRKEKIRYITERGGERMVRRGDVAKSGVFE